MEEERRARGVARGWEEDWGISCVCWGPFARSVLLVAARSYEGEEGEEEERELCLTQCTTSSISEAKRKHVGDLRASPSKQEIPPPVWHLQYLHAVPQYPAARENGRLHVHHRILGSGADATIEMRERHVLDWFTGSLARLGFPSAGGSLSLIHPPSHKPRLAAGAHHLY